MWGTVAANQMSEQGQKVEKAPGKSMLGYPHALKGFSIFN
jgi:hypothetical protein